MVLWLSAFVSRIVEMNDVTICHSERSVSEVEETTHLTDISSKIGAKILRLPTKICDFLRSLRMTYRYLVHSVDHAELTR